MADCLEGRISECHPPLPARAVSPEPRRLLCKACAEAAVPGLKLYPDGWRHEKGHVVQYAGQLGLPL